MAESRTVGSFKLQADLRGLASGAVLEGIKRALAQKARSLVVASFETSVDPYGRPWAISYDKKRKQQKTAGQILRDTNRLMNSFRATPTPAGFTVSSNVVYAAAHNYGIPGKLPARPVIPVGDDMGNWKPALEKVFALAFDKLTGDK